MSDFLAFLQVLVGVASLFVAILSLKGEHPPKTDGRPNNKNK